MKCDLGQLRLAPNWLFAISLMSTARTQPPSNEQYSQSEGVPPAPSPQRRRRSRTVCGGRRGAGPIDRLRSGGAPRAVPPIGSADNTDRQLTNRVTPTFICQSGKTDLSQARRHNDIIRSAGAVPLIECKTEDGARREASNAATAEHRPRPSLEWYEMTVRVV